MDVRKFKDKIEQIENKCGELIEKYYSFTNATPEKQIFVGLLNDAVNTLQDMVRDKYLFDVSLENYENSITFQPSYYLTNISLRNSIVFERIIFLLAICFEECVDEAVKYKNIDPLYKKIKKNQNIPIDIKNKLYTIKGNNFYGKLKEKRDINEHSLSEHLNIEKFRNFVDDSPYEYDVENKVITYDSEKQKSIVTEYDRMIFAKDKMILNDLYNNINIYCDIVVFIIEYMRDKIHDISIHGISNFRCDYIDDGEPIDISKCASLEKDCLNLRNIVEKIINNKNKYFLDCNDIKNKERNTLLIDFVYRLKEIVRSLNYDYIVYFYENFKEKHFDFQVEDYNKYIANEFIGYDYYLFYLMMKIYSINEKIIKFLCYKFNIENVESSSEELLEKLNVINEHKNEKLINILNNINSSLEYKVYEKFRNTEYHFISQKYFFGRNDFNYFYLKIITFVIDNIYNLTKTIVLEEEEMTKLMIDCCPYKNHIK